MVRIMVRCSVAGELPPSSVPPLKKLRRPYVVKDDDEEEILDTVYEEETTFNAAFDMGILRCGGCSSSLSAPIYQCSNGHLACSICHFRESNECLNCFEKIGNIRCLVVEKLIESLRVSCEHELYGCTKKLKYSMKTLHERECPFRPYLCPIPNCIFSALPKDFSSHFLESHQVRTCELKYGSYSTILLGSNERNVLLKVEDKLLLLYNDKEKLGNIAFLRLFGPFDEMCFMYHLVVRKGKRRLSLRSHPQSMYNIEKKRIGDFLFIPMQTYSTNEDSLEVEVCIRRAEYYLDL